MVSRVEEPTLIQEGEPVAMKTKKPVLKRLILAAGVLLCCALNLPAQTAPTITTQPTNQTVLGGANVTFTVAVAGTGPFTYQWQFNGVNFPNNIITTVAGNGANAYVGDGEAATNLSLSYPSGVALDAAGDLYIADTWNNRIRKVDTQDIITTVAGNGSETYAGDGGAAINASLFRPLGVAVDGAGDLYIADTQSQRVRKVDTNGIITTVAGNGTTGYSGDGGAATNASLNYPVVVALDAAGDLYITDNNRIRKVDTNGIITTVAGNRGAGYAGDGNAATNANLNYPAGVALDAFGNVYIADTDNSRIRQVDTNGNISTVAGGGTGGDGGAATNASLNCPTGVVFDALGNLYIADQNNNRIRKVDTNGVITTVAGNGNAAYAGDGGAATNASLKTPFGVACDALGNLYISDLSNNRIRKVVPPGYPTLTLAGVSARSVGSYTVVITNLYGSATGAVATLTVQAPPLATVLPAGQIAVAGSDSRFSVAVAGSGPFWYAWYFDSTNLLQSGANSTLSLPGVSTNDIGNYTVVVTNAWGSVTSQVATVALVIPPSGTTQPGSQTVLAGANVNLSVTVDGNGPFSYQWQFNGTNLPANIITTVAGNGIADFAGDGGAATNASLYHPRGLAFDAAGSLYIADEYNNRIRKVDTNGVITSVAGIGPTGVEAGGYSGDGGAATNASLYIPTSVAVDAAGNLYIADLFNGRVRHVDASGVITTLANFQAPVGVALDATGNVYVADQGNEDIYEVTSNSAKTVVVSSSGRLRFIQGVSVDAVGNLYIADELNQRIAKVNNAFTGLTTVAGKVNAGGFSGDGGLATAAKLSYPQGVTLDTAGNLYIADAGNRRIRKVDTNGIISTLAGNGSTNYLGDGGTATNAGLDDPECVALDAAGNLYIADYAEQRVREVHLAGSPTLTLTNVTAGMAGSYSVVISSSYGSVTSAVATLNVAISAPQIVANDSSFGFAANQFGFNLSGAFGQTIVVDGSTNLVDWTPLFTNTVGGGAVYFCDPASTNSPWRFYRARLQ